MTSLKILSFRHWGHNHKRIAIAFVLLSFLGFLDATYLTVTHFRGGIVPCANIGNCEKVLTSEYAVVAGIPVALLGSIYYLTIFLLSYLSLTRKNERLLLIASRCAILGILASVVLVYLQLFVIRAICLYCMFSAAISTTLFLCSLVLLIVKRRAHQASKGVVL